MRTGEAEEAGLRSRGLTRDGDGERGACLILCFLALLDPETHLHLLQDTPLYLSHKIPFLVQSSSGWFLFLVTKVSSAIVTKAKSALPWAGSSSCRLGHEHLTPCCNSVLSMQPPAPGCGLLRRRAHQAGPRPSHADTEGVRLASSQTEPYMLISLLTYQPKPLKIRKILSALVPSSAKVILTYISPCQTDIECV